MKRANPAKRICPYSKTISQQFQGSDIYIFIADIQNITIDSEKLIDYLFLIKYRTSKIYNLLKTIGGIKS